MHIASTDVRPTLACAVNAPLEPGDAIQAALSATHALSERLQAMMSYFAVARRSLSNGDRKAAGQLMVRFLEQNDRAREIAELISAFTKEPQP